MWSTVLLRPQNGKPNEHHDQRGTTVTQLITTSNNGIATLQAGPGAPQILDGDIIANVAQMVSENGHCYTDIVTTHYNEVLAGEGTCCVGALCSDPPPIIKSRNDDTCVCCGKDVPQESSDCPGADHADSHSTYRLVDGRQQVRDDPQETHVLGCVKVTGASNPQKYYTDESSIYSDAAFVADQAELLLQPINQESTGQSCVKGTYIEVRSLSGGIGGKSSSNLASVGTGVKHGRLVVQAATCRYTQCGTAASFKLIYVECTKQNPEAPDPNSLADDTIVTLVTNIGKCNGVDLDNPNPQIPTGLDM